MSKINQEKNNKTEEIKRTTTKKILLFLFRKAINPNKIRLLLILMWTKWMTNVN